MQKGCFAIICIGGILCLLIGGLKGIGFCVCVGFAILAAGSMLQSDSKSFKGTNAVAFREDVGSFVVFVIVFSILFGGCCLWLGSK